MKGIGKYKYKNGDLYEGNFKQDKGNDRKGKLTKKDGTIIKGEVVDFIIRG